jgi:SAM-dependent methyltransferase
MATQYPECLFTAIEVIPDSLQALPSLPNISFIRDRPYDKGIDFPDNSVDYIHLRSMGLTVGMDKWPLLFKEARRILKPDGVIRIEEICNAVSFHA